MKKTPTKTVGKVTKKATTKKPTTKKATAKKVAKKATKKPAPKPVKSTAELHTQSANAALAKYGAKGTHSGAFGMTKAEAATVAPHPDFPSKLAVTLTCRCCGTKHERCLQDLFQSRGLCSKRCRRAMTKCDGDAKLARRLIGHVAKKATAKKATAQKGAA